MPFHIARPEITNISKETWNALRAQWQFWVGLCIAVITFVVLLQWSRDLEISLIPFFIFAIYIGVVQGKIATSFWRRFAEVNGWKYITNGDPDQELGLMFQQGAGRRISHVIEGVVGDRRFRIFNYEFGVGSGDNQKIYYYTVFVFTFDGSFPHIYLNNKRNSYSIKAGEVVPLPSEFEKQFSLSAPRKYEIEALAIFTPDVLARLLDNEFAHDVEFIDHKVLIFTDGLMNTFEKLEQEFNRVLELEDLLDEKLDRFKFQPVGDMAHRL